MMDEYALRPRDPAAIEIRVGYSMAAHGWYLRVLDTDKAAWNAYLHTRMDNCSSEYEAEQLNNAVEQEEIYNMLDGGIFTNHILFMAMLRSVAIVPDNFEQQLLAMRETKH